MRVIYSNVQALDIVEGRRYQFIAAVEAGETFRESYIADETGQKAYHFKLVGYLDPDSAHRWCVGHDGPAEYHYMDTHDLAEATAAYEHLVRQDAAARGEEYEDGEDNGTTARVLREPFDYTDVVGLRGENGAGESGSLRAARQALVWADTDAAAK
jgi:hypothetical protein